MKEWLCHRKQTLIYILCIVCIFTYNIRNIKILSMPNILFDEFGYLSTGAYWAGRDWTSIVSNFVTYYSYGAGLFYALILKCVQDTVMAYKIIIILNSIFVCMGFIVANYICKQFIDRQSIRITLCFALCFYPSVIHHTQFAWTETLLFLLFWLLLLLISKSISSNSAWVCCLLSFLGYYMYAVHQRSIGVLMTLIIIMCFTYYTENISKRQLFVFFMCLIFCFCVHGEIKQYVQEHIWKVNLMGNDTLKIGDYGGQISKISFLFTPKGMKCFVIGLWGKFMYMGLSSFFFGLEGIYYIVKYIKRFLIEIYRRQFKGYHLENVVLLVFALISLISTMFISALFHIYPSRIDTVMYGRYTDWLVPFITILGVYSVWKEGRKSERRLVVYIFCTLFFLIVFNNLVAEYNLYAHFASCSPIGLIYREIFCRCEVDRWINLEFLMTVLASSILWLFLSLDKFALKYIAVIGMGVLWIVITSPAIDRDIHLNNQEMIQEVVESICSLPEEDDIYFLAEDDGNILYIASVQYLLGQRSITVIEPGDMNSIEDGIIISNLESKYESDLTALFTMLESNEVCCIWYK